jgi:hypothetical protein
MENFTALTIQHLREYGERRGARVIAGSGFLMLVGKTTAAFANAVQDRSGEMMMELFNGAV